MASERSNAAAAGDLTPVPCRGSAPLAQALLTGEVRCALPGTAGARAQIQGGRREALGPAARPAQRTRARPAHAHRAVPDRWRGLDLWSGLVAPVKTPPEIVAFLNRNVAAIVAEPAFRIDDFGGVSPPAGDTPEAFAEVTRREPAMLPRKAQGLGQKPDCPPTSWGQALARRRASG